MVVELILQRERERQIKGFRREKKNRMVEKMNPMWSDLYFGISG